LMTHRNDIVWFDITDNEEKIRSTIIEHPHTIYPVCEEDIDTIKGIVSLKDIYVTDDKIPFKDLMKPALFVPENNTAYQVMEKFKESKIHHCFIVDEYGSVQGMITLNDIMEAIIGTIPQTETADYDIIEREDGSFLIDAQIPFYDFLTRFDKQEWMNESVHEYDTLAGCILHELERIPQAGDKMQWKGFTFEIMDMDGHRIDKVLVTASPEILDEMEEE
jgi:putative hemolysin